MYKHINKDNGSINNLKKLLNEKHNDIECIFNLIQFYESKVEILEQSLNSRKENLSKRELKKIEKQNQLNKYSEELRLLREQENNIGNSNTQELEIENIIKLNKEFEERLNTINIIETELDDKQKKLKVQYNLLSEDEKLLFNKMSLEYDNKTSPFNNDINKYVKDNGKYGKVLNQNKRKGLY